jgi:hypothetical protein
MPYFPQRRRKKECAVNGVNSLMSCRKQGKKFYRDY